MPASIPTEQDGFQGPLALADVGDANARHRLAEAYRLGREIEQDHVAALQWYRAAAEEGHARAQNDLGSMYLNGLGTEPNAEEAAKWYRLAAEQGQPIAQYNLAQQLLWGTGLLKDDRAAAEWLGKAAMQGHIEAICELGTLYRFGRGIEQNFVKAAELHVIAALAGDATAVGNLSDYYPEIEKAALNGSALAALSLAKMYDNGIVVDKDKAKVLAWLRWGEAYGTEGDDVQDELDDMLDFYSLTISDAEKATAEVLFQHFQKEHPGTKSRTRIVNRTKQEARKGFILMGGGFVPKKEKNST